MRILSLTTLYPSQARPSHGIFVENRLRALAARGHQIRVVAPIPRFPFASPVFGEYSRYAATPRDEIRHGIKIVYPRYTLLPKIGMTLAASNMALCFKSAFADCLEDGFLPDLLDAHYYYPDGVAAAMLAKHCGLPLVVTARGTDINLIPKFPRQKRMILDAADTANASITVAEALRTEMIDLGAAEDKIYTVRNGVDLDTFSPPDSPETDAPFTIVSVGHLIERKGHHLVIEALGQIPNAQLRIAGRGPDAKKLRSLAKSMGLADRVTFLGEVSHDQLKDVYGSADVTVLASSREGWPNVLLESMACGTPCVATPVWGSGEVIADKAAGRLTASRTSNAIASAIAELRSDPPTRQETRAYAEQFGWGPVAEKVESIWQNCVHQSWGAPTRLPESLGERFMLTVDTEEVFDWNGTHKDYSVPHVKYLEQLQNAAEAVGVVPLYFVTYPLLKDPEIRDALSGYISAGEAECGLHLHTWATPPDGESADAAGTFQCNLENDLHAKKLASLIAAFKDAFGFSPMSHRAGRYGAAPWVLDQLAENGVLFDFSPSSGFDASQKAGPDFTRFGLSPRRRQTDHGTQWIIPVSGARKWRGTRSFPSHNDPLSWNLPHAAFHRTSVGVRLSPEGHTLAQLRDLTTHLRKTSGTLLTPSLHLTSIIPGATPYAGSEASTENVLSVLTDWMVEMKQQGVLPTTLQELSEAVQAGNRSPNTPETVQSSR